MAIGLIALIFGFSTDAQRAWPSLMINNYFFLAIGAFAIFFVALQYVAEAGWAITVKRVAEAKLLLYCRRHSHDFYHYCESCTESHLALIL